MRFLVPAAIALATSSAAGQSSGSDAVDTATFRAICGTCHSITLVEGLRTESEWREEVDQMIKIGARGTEEQFQRVMRVLTRTLTKVNVNTATVAQLGSSLGLSGLGAEAIVKYRAANGKFQTLEDLKKVPGLDAARLEACKDRLMF